MPCNRSPGRGCLVWGVPGPWGVCSWGGSVPGGSGPGGSALGGGGGIPACTEADPPGETAPAADGMHPTGMHSCFGNIF